MPAVVWTLSVAGVEKPFASWNAKNPTLSFVNMDEDTCTFTLVGNVTAAPPVAYGQAVRVKRNGTIVFIGIVTDSKATGTPTTAEWRIVCRGPWFQLSHAMYQQDMAVYDALSCAKVTKKTTKVVLFQDTISGAAITTGAQIAHVITYANTLGITIAAGIAPSFVTVPFETVRDMTLADVIRRCLQWTPDAVAWFDYSSGIPVLNCQKRGALTGATFDLAASPALVKSFEVSTRQDLVPTGVRFNYIGMKVCPPVLVPGCPVPPVDSTQQFSTVSQDNSGSVTTWGALVGTVDLAQLSDTATEPAPTGLAAQYYLSLQTVPYQGSVRTQQMECAADVMVGRVLNLANGVAAWASMNALIQQVVLNLSTGETEYTFGPPEHLSPQNFAMLIQMMRRRGLVATSFPVTRPPGPDDTPNCDAAKDPDAKKLIDKTAGNAAVVANGMLPIKTLIACNGGEEVTVSFYGPEA